MGFPSIVSQAQRLILDTLREDEYAIDGTVGNGVDTLFLARAVGPRGRIYAFDVQPEAISSAKQRFEREHTDSSNVEWMLRSHAELEAALPEDAHGHVGAAMFNLGYHPGGNPAIITRVDTTLPALDACIKVLRNEGVLTVVVYPGHPGGAEEALAVETWAGELPASAYQAVKYEFMNAQQRPPYLIAISKRRNYT